MAIQTPSRSWQVFYRETLFLYLFIICLVYVLRTSADVHNELGFTLVNARSGSYPKKKIIDTEFADNLAFFSDSIVDANGSASQCGRRSTENRSVCKCRLNKVHVKFHTGNNIKERD